MTNNCWTPVSEPNGSCHYTHTRLITPLGELLIDWKSWKSDSNYSVYFNDRWITSCYSLEDAKDFAERYIINKIKEAAAFFGYEIDVTGSELVC